ncbi:MAG: hypothetical protein JWN94_3840 [Betaproteobacteria bacterium]|nr:hypothetical protein [Betaproteobacteria bacterium]
MTDRRGRAGKGIVLLAGLLAGGSFACAVHAQPTEEGVASAATPPASRKSSPYRPAKTSKHAKNLYQSVWGVDGLKVSRTASGNLIRFSYRVTDPERAKVLVDKNATPHLIGQRTKAVLQIPVMDKIGQLRQSGKAIKGQEYWMVFSNKGNLIKAGDRVDVLIGNFRAEGLMVE